MWRKFFSEDSKLFFIDIDPDCKKHEGGNAQIVIGDQEDKEFMTDFAAKHGPFDLVIDDGGHFMRQQIVSFEVLFPALKSPGIYLVEDTHSSYLPNFGGGYQKPGSFVEYSKHLIDKMNAWYTREKDVFSPGPLTPQLNGVSFYDSIIVIDKLLHEAPKYIVSAHGKLYAAEAGTELKPIDNKDQI